MENDGTELTPQEGRQSAPSKSSNVRTVIDKNSRPEMPPSSQKQHQNPWYYVPLLYFLQALPVTMVQDVSSLVYKTFGIPNEAIARWTAIISLPWALQSLIGPLVDLNSTKRNWALYGQLIISVLLGAAAFGLRLPHPFEISLACFFVIAIMSTLMNAATDGFYIISLNSEDRSKFVGVQTTFYRLGLLFCKGFLVFFAGLLNDKFKNTTGWSDVFFIAAAIYGLGYLESCFVLPYPKTDVRQENGAESTRTTLSQTFTILAIGLSIYFALSAIVRLFAEGLWEVFDGTTHGSLKGWILPNDPRMIGIPVGHNGVAAEVFQFILCVAIFGIAWNYTNRNIRGTEFGEVFASYFRQKGIIAILFFLMFYRFGEAMVSKMAPLFLADTHAVGGLNLSMEEIGKVVGVSGVVGIVLGGLLGGWVVSKLKLKKSFWYIAISMHLPNLLYLWASYKYPNIDVIYVIAFVDQFGYGFGFAGYLIYQMMVAKRGKFPTSHYALGVGIGVVFIFSAYVLSGVIQANFGYHGLFISVIFMTFPGLLSLLFIPIDPETEALT